MYSSMPSIGASNIAGSICAPFYNHLNLISNQLSLHDHRCQSLPTSSAAALTYARSDLQRRKDELIRQRHGLRQSQRKIYDFHLEQIEKRARNYDTFVSKHQAHWKDAKK